MNQCYFPCFNPEITLLGGQSFSWDKVVENGNTYYIGTTDSKVIKIQYKEDTLYWQTYPEKNDEKFINEYFRINYDYNSVLAKICNDKFVKKALEHVPFVRILKQPLNLTVFSFIMSSNSNIKKIRFCYRELSRLLGRKIGVEGIIYSLFPNAEILLNASLEKLREAKVGYRAKYIKKTAKMLVELNYENRLKNLSCDIARNELLKLFGVGPKVADCILTFALNCENIMPIDVWTRRLLMDLYKVPEKWSYKQIKEWTERNFHGYASLSGQILFEWYRSRKK